MKIEYITQDKSLKFEIEFIFKYKLKYYRGSNKYYPLHTQCILKQNDLLVGFSQIIKHENDKDNKEYALKLSLKKVINKIHCKEIRKIIWSLLFEEIKNSK